MLVQPPGARDYRFGMTVAAVLFCIRKCLLWLGSLGG